MNKLTLKKTAMVIVAAGMAAQSMGLTAFAEEVGKPLEATKVNSGTSSKMSKKQEAILADKILEAQDAVKSKKALLDEALAELQKTQPNYEAQEQIWTASKKQVDLAQTAANDAILDAMKTNLQDIQNAQSELEKAETDKKKADAESAQAESDYKAANEALEKAKEAYNQAVANATDVTQEGIEDAKKAVEEAEKAVETAKANYESAVAKKTELEQAVLESTELLQTAKDELTAIEQKKAFADEEMGQLRFTLKQLQDSIANDTTDEQVAEKQALIDKYQAEFDGLMETVNNYAMEIDKLQEDITTIESDQAQKESELEAIEGKISEAKSTWDAKTEAKVEADEAYKAAEQAVEDNKAESAKLQAVVDEAKKNLDAAQEAHDKALEALGTLKADVINAQAKLDGMTDTYKEAVKKWNQGAYGYYSSLEYGEGVDKEAMYEFESEVLESTSNRFFVKLGEKTDPSGINNMIEAIDYLKACNELRRENGLEDLKIDMGLMSYAQLNSANNIRQLEKNLTYGHTSRFKCGENIAYGPGAWNPYDGWYGEEYELFQKAVESGKYPGLENMSSAQVYQKYPSLWHELGHYYNIMDPTYLYTGYGLGQLVTDDIRDGWYHHSQTFGKKGTGDIVMTVEEYEQSIKGYASGLQQIFDDYKSATEELANAQKALDEASKQTATYEVLENAKKAYSTAQGNLSVSLEKANVLEQEKTDKQNAYTTAVENESKAKVAYEAQVSAKTALEAEIEGLKTQITQLNTQVSEKSSLKDAAFKKTGELSVKIADENHAIEDLKAKKAKLLKAEENAKNAVEEHQKLVDKLSTSVTQAKSNADAKQATLEASKATLLAQDDVINKAKETQDTANKTLVDSKKSYTEMIRLNANVNDAHEKMELAKSEVTKADIAQKAAKAKVSELEKKVTLLLDDLAYFNEEKADIDELKACFESLKGGNLKTEIPALEDTRSVTGHNQMVHLLNAYKTALLDLDSKAEAYNSAKDEFVAKRTAHANAKAEYDKAVSNQEKAENELKAYLQAKAEAEKKAEEEKKKADAEAAAKAEAEKKAQEEAHKKKTQGSSENTTGVNNVVHNGANNGVNTGVETGLGMAAAGMAISALGAEKARRKLSRTNRK